MALRSVQDWLDEYGESHQNPTNKLIHWICVPVIVFSVVGILWSLPVPSAFVEISPAMNWAVLFAMAAVVYYFILSASLAIGMVPILAAMLALAHWISVSTLSLLAVSVTVFVVAWIGQFVGHRIEGKKPSFFKDLLFLMIGPVWLLAFVYKRMGIRY
jgi:uncharacterized membrane protein YGL010W